MFQGVFMKKILYIHVFSILPLIDKNQCFRYISCVKFLFLIYNIVIRPFCEFDLLKITTKLNLWMCTLFMHENLYNTLWGKNFSFFQHNRNIFKWHQPSCIWNLNIFIGRHRQFGFFNGHHWQLLPHIPECAR